MRKIDFSGYQGSPDEILKQYVKDKDEKKRANREATRWCLENFKSCRGQFFDSIRKVLFEEGVNGLTKKQIAALSEIYSASHENPSDFLTGYILRGKEKIRP